LTLRVPDEGYSRSTSFSLLAQMANYYNKLHLPQMIGQYDLKDQ